MAGREETNENAGSKGRAATAEEIHRWVLGSASRGPENRADKGHVVLDCIEVAFVSCAQDGCGEGLEEGVVVVEGKPFRSVVEYG